MLTSLLISAEKSLKDTLWAQLFFDSVKGHFVTLIEVHMDLTPARLSVLIRGDADLFSSVVFFSRLQRIC